MEIMLTEGQIDLQTKISGEMLDIFFYEMEKNKYIFTDGKGLTKFISNLLSVIVREIIYETLKKSNVLEHRTKFLELIFKLVKFELDERCKMGSH